MAEEQILFVRPASKEPPEPLQKDEHAVAVAEDHDDPGLSVEQTPTCFPERRIRFRKGQTLAQVVFLSGLFQPPVLCAGLALCGRCRMRVRDANGSPPPPTEADEDFFSPEALAQGWRLACRHQPAPGMRVELPPGISLFETFPPADGQPSRKPIYPAGPFRERGADSPPPFSREHETRHAALAVDIGTTSLHWRLIRLEENPSGCSTMQLPEEEKTEALWEGIAVNPQIGAGSDVVSRLAVAADAEGRDDLRRIILAALRRLTERANALAVRTGSAHAGVASLCLAANTAMSSIVLGLDTKGLTRAPFSLPYRGGKWEKLPGLPPAWFPPQLSPFVGGDISAGYAALALAPQQPQPDYPFLLADLGTNGEFLLALSPEEAWTASIALGPALEGTGLRYGTEARLFAVTGFSFTPSGLVARLLSDGLARQKEGHPPRLSLQSAERQPFPEKAAGITGTGYLSLLHILLQTGAMDRQGRFTPQNAGTLRRFFLPQTSAHIAQGEAWLALPLGMRLFASDVEEILKVKAAFSLGLQRLLDNAGINAHDVVSIRLAGALGQHIDRRALENLGFFPPGTCARMRPSGNTSLEGAALLLRDEAVRRKLTQWSKGVRTVDLGADPVFRRDFTAHMHFGWLPDRR